MFEITLEIDKIRGTSQVIWRAALHFQGSG